LVHRLAKVFWRGSHERSLPIGEDKIFDADEMVELAHQIIERKGQEGNCVIVGRGAPYILRHRHDTFRVFVYGSREEKVRRMVSLKMEESEAAEMVDTIDAERAAFVRRYFNAEWPSRHLYHMLVNSDPGIDYVTEAVMATMGMLEAHGASETSSKHSRLDPVTSHAR
jgi:cytidylate kinase